MTDVMTFKNIIGRQIFIALYYKRSIKKKRRLHRAIIKYFMLSLQKFYLF